MSKQNAYVIFLVDDDTKLLTMMKHYFSKNSDFNLEIHTFANVQECKDNVNIEPDIIVLDYYFDTTDAKAETGLDAMKDIKERYPQIEVVMISGQDDMEIALETIRMGACDYVIKNESAVVRTHLTIDRILKQRNKEIEHATYKKQMNLALTITIGFIVVMVGVMVWHFAL